jgi:hypothetical protein
MVMPSGSFENDPVSPMVIRVHTAEDSPDALKGKDWPTKKVEKQANNSPIK